MGLTDDAALLSVEPEYKLVLTAIGNVLKNKALNAKVGDTIWVTGTICGKVLNLFYHSK